MFVEAAELVEGAGGHSRLLVLRLQRVRHTATQRLRGVAPALRQTHGHAAALQPTAALHG